MISKRFAFGSAHKKNSKIRALLRPPDHKLLMSSAFFLMSFCAFEKFRIEHTHLFREALYRKHRADRAQVRTRPVAKGSPNRTLSASTEIVSNTIGDQH